MTVTLIKALSPTSTTTSRAYSLK